MLHNRVKEAEDFSTVVMVAEYYALMSALKSF